MLSTQILLLVALCIFACQPLVAAHADDKHEVDFFTAVQSSVRQAEIEITKVILAYEEQYPAIKGYLLQDHTPKSKKKQAEQVVPQESATPEPMYGSPTAAPSFQPDSYCRSLIPVNTNDSTTDQCKTCLSADCIWCESGDYCFSTTSSTSSNTCSSYESGSSSICSVDLAALALLIILIIVFAIVIPCLICGVGALVLCCGVSICCFTASKANNNSTPTYNNNNNPNVVQGQVVGAQQPYVASSPMIVSAASPAVPAVQYGGGTVIHGQVVGSMDMENGAAKNVM